MRILIIFLFSFIIYFLPIPNTYATHVWGWMLWSMWINESVSMLMISLFVIFAFAYQWVFVYYFYKISVLPLPKAIIQGVLGVTIFYLVLIVGVYLIGAMSMQLEVILNSFSLNISTT